MDFVDIRLDHGDDNRRCRDLFTGLWIPDLFMKRVLDDADWTLMSPDVCPGLADKWGAEFESKYIEYEKRGLGTKRIKARRLYGKIIRSQIETGTPYMLFTDQTNLRSQ